MKHRNARGGITVLKRGGAFADAFTLQAAQRVAGASPEQIAAFVEYSVLRIATQDPDVPTPRYEMHQLWLQFARARLREFPQEETRARLAHRRYYLSLLESCTAEARTCALPDFHNAYLAWERLLQEADSPEFEAATCALVDFLEAHNRYDELARLLLPAVERALTRPQRDSTLLARWLRLLGEARFREGKLPESLTYHHQALALLGMSMPASLTGQTLGLGVEILRQIAHRIRMPRPKEPQHSAAFLEAARAYERLGQILFFGSESTPTLLYTSVRGMNLAEMAPASNVLARLYGNMILGGALVPAHAMARFYRRLALAVAHRIDDPDALSWVLELSSIYACGIGDWEASAHDAAQAIALADKKNDARRRNECLVMPAHIAHMRGDFRRSAELWQQIHLTALQNGDVQAQRWGLSGQAENLLILGHLDEAISDLQSALALPLKVVDIGTDISCHGALAYAFYLQGQFADASRAAKAALHLVTTTSPTAFTSLNGYAFLAFACLCLWQESPDDPALAEAASKAVASLMTFSRIFTLGQPEALCLSGTQAWLQGKRAQALRLWQKGISGAQPLQMPYLEAMGYAEMARFLPADDPAKAEAAARCRDICSALRVPALA